MNVIKPLPSALLTVRTFLSAAYPPGRIGGDFAYVPSMEFYVRIALVGSQSDRLEGTFLVDVEVFDADYLEAESRSSDIEALLLGYPHVVEANGRRVVIDDVYQNTGPRELPWEDEGVTRMGATYAITIRRH